MTREEAIAILTETQVVYFAPNGKQKAQEALDMAIEALSSDTVSRETYHNLVIASNDIDRALREYQDKEENGELVSVVRCKECRYWQEQEEGIVECSVCTRIHDMVFEMGADGFCSYGERKGGDE